ncbi:MAG: MFS transporter [Candidatus Hydrogenedentes bacterium]|nr:MFS transporter [Candidatus Hydrogenedentota bacterium]
MFSPHIRLSLAAALLDAALLIGMTAFPFHMYDSFAGTAQTSGVIGGIQATIYGIVCLFTGRFLARSLHPMRWGAFGILACGTLFLLAYPQKDLALFSVFYCTSIGMLSLTWPALHSWLGADPDPDNRGKNMARFNMAWSAGLAVGSLAGGFIYSVHPALPFMCYFAICILSSLLVFSLPEEGKMYDQSVRAENTEDAAYDLRGERLLLSAWIANGLAMALAGITRLVFTKHIDDLVKAGQLRVLFEETPPALLSNATASQVYAIMAFGLCLANAVAFFIMGSTRAWHHRLDVLVIVQCIAGAAVFVLGNTQSVVIMAIAFLAIGVANGAAFFAAVYYCMSNVKKRHARTSINEFAVGAGSALGPIIAGVMMQQAGLHLTFVVIPVIVAGVVLLQCVLAARTPHTGDATLNT